MTTSSSLYKRGEIWLVDLDPTEGTEMKKVRPVVIVSSDAVGILPIKLVAPITGWQSSFEANLWHVKIEPDSQNNLSKTSAVDTLQVRGLDTSTSRFKKKIGYLPANLMEEITASIAAVIEYS